MHERNPWLQKTQWAKERCRVEDKEMHTVYLVWYTSMLPSPYFSMADSSERPMHPYSMGVNTCRFCDQRAVRVGRKEHTSLLLLAAKDERNGDAQAACRSL